MIDHHELVAAARHAHEFNRLASLGLQPDHPDVKAFNALPVPQGDMIERGYLLNEAGMMVAEARETKRSPEIIAKATTFAMNVADMPMVEVRKWLKHFLSGRSEGTVQ